MPWHHRGRRYGGYDRRDARHHDRGGQHQDTVTIKCTIDGGFFYTFSNVFNARSNWGPYQFQLTALDPQTQGIVLSYAYYRVKKITARAHPLVTTGNFNEDSDTTNDTFFAFGTVYALADGNGIWNAGASNSAGPQTVADYLSNPKTKVFNGREAFQWSVWPMATNFLQPSDVTSGTSEGLIKHPWVTTYNVSNGGLDRSFWGTIWIMYENPPVDMFGLNSEGVPIINVRSGQAYKFVIDIEIELLQNMAESVISLREE